jgi:stage V sporulation protein R
LAVDAKALQLSHRLSDLQQEIEAHASAYGLDPFNTVFEVLDYRQMNQVAAFGGFPTRYPHWRFGMEYEQLSKSYAYGLHKIYEMVINNDPTYAYLLEGNTMVDQKLVMAHVYGHGDFFKNNVYFRHTDRKMVDTMANHATRVRRYIERFGIDPVERFLDACLSVEELIDPQVAFLHAAGPRPVLPEEPPPPTVRKLPAKDYLEKFVNPPEFLEAERSKLQEAARAKRRTPPRPDRSVLGILLDHAPLRNWERDCLAMIRDEAYYFLPQRQTKIMNEGWASYWHTKIMTQRALKDAEVVDYADHHSSTVATAPGRLNPYKLGLELFRDIEDRWNRGCFGKEWDECDSMAERNAWDRQLGQGRERMFEVRRLYCDVTFVDEFLTEDFCRRHRFFTFAHDRRRSAWVVQSREFAEVKKALLFQLTNCGMPVIEVTDINHGNRGELLLAHRHVGVDLRENYAKQVLVNLHRIWKRPVQVETVVAGRPKVLGFDGTDHLERDRDSDQED